MVNAYLILFSIMKHAFAKTLLVIISFFFISVSSSIAADTTQDAYKWVLKIKTYTRNDISGHYSFTHYGSAVLIEKNRIITNAHVILDGDGVSPTGYYEVCKSEKTQQVPTCFSTAKLISYDVVADLAVLELATATTNIKSAVFSDIKSLPMSSSVVVYGYPAIGWFSITRTEWKIGGMDNKKYKFDGTIDHGNSGGGAFGSDGKLIGIPYAVKSDNGMIGYIIPISIVWDFLAGKTDNIEKYTQKIEIDFLQYIKNSEALYKNPNSIKTKYVDIKNAQRSGFTLVNTVASTNGEIFLYQFLDKNNSVVVSVGCTKDAATTWTSSIEYQKSMLELPDQNLKTNVSTGYIDAKKSAYMVEYIDVKETKWVKWAMALIVYDTAPRCASLIAAGDIKNKDKSSYEKGITFIKSIKFLDTTRISATFSSSFFSSKNIPKNVMFSEWPSLVQGWDISPSIGILFPGEYKSSSSFEEIKFDDLDGYMNYEYSDSNQYKGKDYSFDAFFRRYRTTGYSNVSDTEFSTKDGKKFIMTVRNYNDTTVFPEKYEQVVTFFYPFVTKDGKYRAYRFEFTLHAKDGMGAYDVSAIIASLELPGTSPFKN